MTISAMKVLPNVLDVAEGTGPNDQEPIARRVPRALALRENGLVQARTRHVEACVAQVFGVPHESLRASTRGKACVALARQVAMYICHTTLGFSLTTVGTLFDRDRTTVGHACRRVEDLRDFPDFDARLVCLERTVLAGCIPTSLRAKAMPWEKAYV